MAVPLMSGVQEEIDGVEYTYYQEDMDEVEKMSHEECIRYIEEQEEKMRQRNEKQRMVSRIHSCSSCIVSSQTLTCLLAHCTLLVNSTTYGVRSVCMQMLQALSLMWSFGLECE